MYSRLNTCRFCSEMMSSGLIRYGSRHYAHPRCYLDAGKRLEDLNRFQVEQFPFMLLKERGLTDEARRIINERK